MALDRLTTRVWKSRLLQRLFGMQVNVRESWEREPERMTSMVEFLGWFDRTSSIEETVERGRRDWQHRFAGGRHFSGLHKGRALEIGFGGGRLLLHAARDFEHVVGIDIHRNFALSADFLGSQGVRNFKLLHRDEFAEVADASVDFVYSFIVFQHFDGLDEVDFYLGQIARVLAPHGLAQIFYGKSKGDDEVSVTPASEFRLRDCSLFIAPTRMRALVESRFELIEYADQLPRDAEANSGESVQAMVLFSKRR